MEKASMDLVSSAREYAGRVGISIDVINQLLTTYGPKVVTAVANLVASGLSISWVLTTLQELGPMVIDLLSQFKSEARPLLEAHASQHASMMAGSGGLQEGEQVGADSILVGPFVTVLLMQLKAYLPQLGLTGVSLQIVTALVDALLASQAK